MASAPVWAEVKSASENSAAMEQKTAVLRTMFIFSSSGCDASIQGGVGGGAEERCGLRRSGIPNVTLQV